MDALDSCAVGLRQPDWTVTLVWYELYVRHVHDESDACDMHVLFTVWFGFAWHALETYSAARHALETCSHMLGLINRGLQPQRGLC